MKENYNHIGMKIKIHTLTIFLIITFFSCTKIKDIPPPDDKYRQQIIGEWLEVDLFTGDRKLIFLENGFYQEWLATSNSWKLVTDSVPYAIEKGLISLPHDGLGPNPHKILALDEQTFSYEASGSNRRYKSIN